MGEKSRFEEGLEEKRRAFEALTEKQRRIAELEKLMQRGNPAQREQARKKIFKLLRGEEEE